MSVHYRHPPFLLALRPRGRDVLADETISHGWTNWLLAVAPTPAPSSPSREPDVRCSRGFRRGQAAADRSGNFLFAHRIAEALRGCPIIIGDAETRNL